MLSVKHLIDTNSLTRDDIQQILDTAQSFEAVNNRDIKKGTSSSWAHYC